MTVTTSDSSVTYTGNSSTTQFPYSFVVPDEASLKVELLTISTGARTVLTSSDYSVTGIGDSSGGTVTYPTSGTAIDSDTKIIIYRQVALTQETSVTNQTAYFADVVEAVWDKHTMALQEQKEEARRSIKIERGGVTDITFPANMATNTTLRWDGAKFIEGPKVAEVSNAETYATNAKGSADAAASSANAAAASLDSFDDRYLGEKATEPTTDNDGATLLTGALYWNSTEGEMRLWNGSTWIPVSMDPTNVDITGGTIAGISSLNIARSGAADQAVTVALNDSGNILTGYSPTGTPRAFIIQTDADSGGLSLRTNDASYPITFFINGAEQMRLTPTGRLGINTNNPAAPLDVAGNAHLSAATTETRRLEIGYGRSGDGATIIDLIGDATYADFGARIFRKAGANAGTEMVHRGTGSLAFTAYDAAPIKMRTKNLDRVTFTADYGDMQGRNGAVYQNGTSNADLATTIRWPGRALFASSYNHDLQKPGVGDGPTGGSFLQTGDSGNNTSTAGTRMQWMETHARVCSALNAGADQNAIGITGAVESGAGSLAQVVGAVGAARLAASNGGTTQNVWGHYTEVTREAGLGGVGAVWAHEIGVMNFAADPATGSISPFNDGYAGMTKGIMVNAGGGNSNAFHCDVAYQIRGGTKGTSGASFNAGLVVSDTALVKYATKTGVPVTGKAIWLGENQSIAFSTAAGGAGNAGIEAELFASASGALVLGRYEADPQYILFQMNGATTGYIEEAAGTTSLVSASDARLKEDIKDAEPLGDAFDNLRVRSYRWTESGTEISHGFVAQELHEAYAPAARVGGDDPKEEPWGITQEALIPVLVKEVQELRKRVAQLEAKLA